MGRAKDAGECLLALIDTLGEEVNTSNPITNWVFGGLMPHQFSYCDVYVTVLS